MASKRGELPAAALKALAKGVPADKVLLPEIDLTPKQRQFVRAMAEGASKRDAYLQAYDAHADSRSVGVTACHIAAQPKIKSAIEQQRAVERLRYSQNPLDIRNFVVDSLQHLARTAKKDGDRLNALRLLGQLADVDAFQTRSVVTHESGSARQRLRDKLARLGSVIDVDATPTAPPPPQTGPASGGPPRSTNPHIPANKSSEPHERSTENTLTPNLQDTLTPNLQGGYPYEEEITPPMGGVSEEEAPLEKDVGSHVEGGGKKEKPIWEDPKRWYEMTIGEVPKIEWFPIEEARDEVQRRLKNDAG
jgi:hypothetical protein